MYWNIGKIIGKRANLTPKKTAIIFEDRPITYKMLNDDTNRFAHYLQKAGIKKGDRIALNLLNCPQFITIFFAAAKLGIIIVPLNFRIVAEELKYQLNDSGARMLLFHDIVVKNIEPVKNAVKIEKDKFICLKSNLPDQPKCPKWAIGYDKVIADMPVYEPDPAGHIDCDDPLAIIYTSGVTGNPKGAVLSHIQTYFKNFQITMYTDMRSSDIFLSQLPLFRSGGLFISAMPVLCRGATMILRQNHTPLEFAEDIGKYRATIIFALTNMWRFIIHTKALDDVDISSVRCVIGGGEKTPPKLVQELANKGLYMQSGFGQTENSFMTLLPKADIQRKEGSVGLPGFFTEVWIENEKKEKAMPGEVGEIVASGPTVVSGYWNMPDKSDETIINGVLHTGDIGYTDEEGYFYIVGRADDLYIRGGENVYPAEVEKILANHPKIEDIAIIGVPDMKWGETGVAVIVAKEGVNISKREIREYLKGKVAGYKIPTHTEFVESLPKTASGKIKKAKLKEWFLTGWR